MKGSHNQQQGLAMLILVFMIALALTGYLFVGLDSESLKRNREAKTAMALAEAKAALLGWSIRRGAGEPGMPGQLPCPEDTGLIGTPNEGSALANCNSALPVIGRLPWRTLGLGDVRDGNGEKLWYVLSNGFRASPVNSTTPGQINVNGIPNVAVALIFSPGIPLAGQARPTPTSMAPPIPSEYLDLTNQDGDINYADNGPLATFNDKLLILTQAELFGLVEKRILREILGDNTQGLTRFYMANANVYPYADVNNDGVSDPPQLIGTPSYEGVSNPEPDNLFFNTALKNILINNNWMPLINYQVSNDRQSVTISINGQTLNAP